MRVRGLKPYEARSFHDAVMSHPVRVRGLKLYPGDAHATGEAVAPRAGAWVETLTSC